MEVRFASKFWSVVVGEYDEVRGPSGEASLQDFVQNELPDLRTSVEYAACQYVQDSGSPKVVYYRGFYAPLYVVDYWFDSESSVTVLDVCIERLLGL